MSPVHSDEGNYTDQLVLCLVLILCVSLSLGAYIMRFNAQIDKQRSCPQCICSSAARTRGFYRRPSRAA